MIVKEIPIFANHTFQFFPFLHGLESSTDSGRAPAAVGSGGAPRR